MDFFLQLVFSGHRLILRGFEPSKHHWVWHLPDTGPTCRKRNKRWRRERGGCRSTCLEIFLFKLYNKQERKSHDSQTYLIKTGQKPRLYQWLVLISVGSEIRPINHLGCIRISTTNLPQLVGLISAINQLWMTSQLGLGPPPDKLVPCARPHPRGRSVARGVHHPQDL